MHAHPGHDAATNLAQSSDTVVLGPFGAVFANQTCTSTLEDFDGLGDLSL